MRKSWKFYEKRCQCYINTYFAMGLGFIYTPNGERIKNGFLYQEPNPDYDLGLPENCTPIFFKDGLKDKIPEGLPKPKIGSKGHHVITPRPIVCVETGEFFMTSRDCDKAYGINNSKDACRRLWFKGDKRFTYIDPFMDGDNEPGVGLRTIKNFNKRSSGNRRNPVIIEETGEYFKSVQECCQVLAKRFNVSEALIGGRIKRFQSIFGLTARRTKGN